MKILVLGGMHGNEMLGQEIVKAFRKKPAKNVAVCIANEEAVEANSRFTNKDLNRSFPGSIRDSSYESRRAAELTRLCKQYDIVLDFHNTYCPDNDCSFIGENALPILERASLALGLKRVIVADYDCINKYALNCISVEISLTSKLNNVEYWIKAITDLASKDNLEQSGNVEKYRFVYRMTLEDRDKLKLANELMCAFEPISKDIAEALGVVSPAFPIFIGDKFTPYNFGGLLNKID